MLRVLIIGAGGHAQVVADILFQAQKHGAEVDVVGYLDDNPALHGRELLGRPVWGGIDMLDRVPHDGVIVAIGDNATRARLFAWLKQREERLINAIHPAATIAPHVQLGEGVMIAAGVVVNTGTIIGHNVILNTGCTVDHHNRIEDHVHIAPGAHLGGDVSIGEGTLVGLGALVLPQRQIGAWTVVGAGAVVTRSLPSRVVAVGVPARIIKAHLQQGPLGG